MMLAENINKLTRYLNIIEYSDFDLPFHPLTIGGDIKNRTKFKRILRQLEQNKNTSKNLIKMFEMLDNKQIYLSCCRALWLEDLNKIFTELRANT